MVPLSSFVAAKNASIARPLVTEEEEVTSELEESDTVAGLPQDIKVIKGRVMVKTRRFITSRKIVKRSKSGQQFCFLYNLFSIFRNQNLSIEKLSPES